MPAKVRRHRFPILIGTAGRLLMLPIGVTENRAFAEIKGSELRVRFGPMFDEHFPIEEIETAELAEWPLWAGLGPRTTFLGTMGLVGSYSNVVELTFKSPQRVHLFVMPTRCRHLFLTLEEPDAFLAALKEAPEEEKIRAA